MKRKTKAPRLLNKDKRRKPPLGVSAQDIVSEVLAQVSGLKFQFCPSDLASIVAEAVSGLDKFLNFPSSHKAAKQFQKDAFLQLAGIVHTTSIGLCSAIKKNSPTANNVPALRHLYRASIDLGSAFESLLRDNKNLLESVIGTETEFPSKFTLSGIENNRRTKKLQLLPIGKKYGLVYVKNVKKEGMNRLVENIIMDVQNDPKKFSKKVRELPALTKQSFALWKTVFEGYLDLYLSPKCIRESKMRVAYSPQTKFGKHHEAWSERSLLESNDANIQSYYRGATGEIGKWRRLRTALLKKMQSQVCR